MTLLKKINLRQFEKETLVYVTCYFNLIFSARNEPSKVVNRETSERAEKRKKKKSYYAKLKREEDDKMAELAAKYRDR